MLIHPSDNNSKLVVFLNHHQSISEYCFLLSEGPILSIYKKTAYSKHTKTLDILTKTLHIDGDISNNPSLFTQFIHELHAFEKAMTHPDLVFRIGSSHVK